MNSQFSIRKRLQQLDQEQSGAAFTEFAITLPVFVLLMTGLLQLGAMGQASVAVKKDAYADMWTNAYESTQETSIGDLTPRTEAANAIPGEFSGTQIAGAANSAATAAGGHWGEAMMKANTGGVLSGGTVSYTNRDTEAAKRLDDLNMISDPTSVTSTILGEDRGTRPSMALNDNLADGDIGDHLSGVDSVGGLASGLAGGILQASGVVPPLFAGIRYGDETGEGERDVEFENNFLSHTETFSASYSTALSPLVADENTIPGTDLGQVGDIGREQQQWFFYYLTGQTIDNKRHALDVLDQDLDGDDGFSELDRY